MASFLFHHQQDSLVFYAPDVNTPFPVSHVFLLRKHIVDNNDITVVPGIWDDPNGALVPDPALGGEPKRLYVKRSLDSDNYQSVFVDDDDDSVWDDC